MTNFLIFIAILLFTSIPFKNFFTWFFQCVSDINKKMEKPNSTIFCPKTTFSFFLAQIADFSKGILPGLIIFYYFESDYLLLVLIPLCLTAHNWSFLSRFKNQNNFIMINWGVYTYLNPVFFFLYPLTYFISALLTNSLLLAPLLNIFLFFIFIWFFNLNPLYFLLNLAILFIVLLASYPKLLKYLEQKTTILQSFLKR